MAEIISSYSTSNGHKLFYRFWPCTRGDTADGAPCLILIHGIESHSGWFSEVGESLAGLGFEVYALDRRGSGLNKEGRGDLSDFHRLIQDVDDFFLQKNLDKKRCILIGICWGAKVALYFFLHNPQRISKIIFVTPGFKTKLRTSSLTKVKWGLALTFAPHRILDLPIEPEMFTMDEMYLQRIREDKLRLKTITSRFFKENLRMEKAIRRLDAKVDVPCLLSLAGEDDIIDNDGVITFLKRYFRNLEIKSYSRCRHGLFFEPSKGEAIQDMANWIR